jgi:predicted HicB family RNase H-like nuclease
MSRDDPQMKLRLPPELKARVEEAARASGRSINAELVQRIAASFDLQIAHPTRQPRGVTVVEVKAAAHEAAEEALAKSTETVLAWVNQLLGVYGLRALPPQEGPEQDGRTLRLVDRETGQPVGLEPKKKP